MDPDPDDQASATEASAPLIHEQNDQHPGDLDLATLGLAVFFIAVIGVVAALLIVQNLT